MRTLALSLLLAAPAAAQYRIDWDGASAVSVPAPTAVPAYGGTPRGGYYYGFFRAADGRIVYGKAYVPHYGDFDGNAHNDPYRLRYAQRYGRYRRLPPYFTTPPLIRR